MSYVATTNIDTWLKQTVKAVVKLYDSKVQLNSLTILAMLVIHPSVTDLLKPDLVGYFALPGGIVTSLAPADYIKNPW